MIEKLTSGKIYSLENLKLSNLIDILNDEPEINNVNFFLIISSKHSQCIKITIYPINKDNVLKLSLKNMFITKKKVQKLISILKNYEIIHSTGLLIKNDKMFYECYIKVESKEENITENQIYEIFLNKIKKFINDIKIERLYFT